MRIGVALRQPGAPDTLVAPGQLIGRSAHAALRVDEPRVSGAHALVSLRGPHPLLLALRGRLVVEGRRVTEVVLEVGQRVALARDLALEVAAVHLPREVVGLRGPGLHAPLPGATGLATAPLRLVHPTSSEARGWCWPTDDGQLRVRRPDQPDTVVTPGASFSFDGTPIEVVRQPVARALDTVAGTEHGTGMRLVLRYDTVHIHQPGHAPLLLEGLPARMFGELASFGVPVEWSVLAAQLWPDAPRPALLRKRLDGALHRLRQRLAQGRARTDLVRATGQGLIELVLDPSDELEDQQ